MLDDRSEKIVPALHEVFGFIATHKALQLDYARLVSELNSDVCVLCSITRWRGSVAHSAEGPNKFVPHTGRAIPPCARFREAIDQEARRYLSARPLYIHISSNASRRSNRLVTEWHPSHLLIRSRNV